MNKRALAILICITLIAGCVPQQQYQQEAQQVQQLLYMNSTYQQLNQQLLDEVKSDQVQIKQLKDRLQVTMVNQILFSEGGWEVDRKGKELLARVAPTLSGLDGKQILIEGYTDSLPIEEPLKSRFPNNWYLSAARAIQVVEFLQTQGVDSSALVGVAYGQYRPVASNDTPEGRSKNRRINIVITDRTS
jgi:chemotaxis protein MotB